MSGQFLPSALVPVNPPLMTRAVSLLLLLALFADARESRIYDSRDKRVGSYDDVIVTVVAATNEPPAVSAGPDLEVTRPQPAQLFGAVSDDGLPPGHAVDWHLVRGERSRQRYVLQGFHHQRAAIHHRHVQRPRPLRPAPHRLRLRFHRKRHP